MEQPELVHLDLRWNRVIIRNYAGHFLDVLYPPDRRMDFARPLFIAGYRNLLAAFLPSFSALAIHGSGMVRNGQAAVFLAPDEGGKTSVVRHLPIESILNDDHVMLRMDGGSVIAHGTPFGNITGGPQQARLGGLFLLEKAPRFELAPVSRTEVLQFLWKEHEHIWFLLPKPLRVSAYNILASACRQAVTYRMRFSIGDVDWDAIEAVMAESPVPQSYE